MRVGIAQVMHRDQIDLMGPVFFERLLDLLDAFLPPHVAQTDLGGEKQGIANLETVDQFADHRLRRAVGWRTIDHLGAERLELPDRFAQRRFLRVVLDFLVTTRRAEADDRDALARGRNLLLQERLRLRQSLCRPQQQRRAQTQTRFNHGSTIAIHLQLLCARRIYLISRRSGTKNRPTTTAERFAARSAKPRTDQNTLGP